MVREGENRKVQRSNDLQKNIYNAKGTKKHEVRHFRKAQNSKCTRKENGGKREKQS